MNAKSYLFLSSKTGHQPVFSSFLSIQCQQMKCILRKIAIFAPQYNGFHNKTPPWLFCTLLEIPVSISECDLISGVWVGSTRSHNSLWSFLVPINMMLGTTSDYAQTSLSSHLAASSSSPRTLAYAELTLRWACQQNRYFLSGLLVLTPMTLTADSLEDANTKQTQLTLAIAPP